MSVKEKLKKRDVTSVQYSVSEQGLHVKINGWKEFIITRQQMMLINGKLFDQQIKDNEQPMPEVGENKVQNEA